MKQSRRDRVVWQMQQTLSHTLNSAVQKMQQAIEVASATWRYWLGKSAWAHVRVPAEMLAHSFAGLDRDQFLQLHLFVTVWMVASITLTGCLAQLHVCSVHISVPSVKAFLSPSHLVCSFLFSLLFFNNNNNNNIFYICSTHNSVQ